MRSFSSTAFFAPDPWLKAEVWGSEPNLTPATFQPLYDHFTDTAGFYAQSRRKRVDSPRLSRPESQSSAQFMLSRSSPFYNSNSPRIQSDSTSIVHLDFYCVLARNHHRLDNQSYLLSQVQGLAQRWRFYSTKGLSTMKTTKVRRIQISIHKYTDDPSSGL